MIADIIGTVGWLILEWTSFTALLWIAQDTSTLISVIVDAHAVNI